MTDTNNIVRFERPPAADPGDAHTAAPSHFNDDLLQVDRAMAEFTSIMMMTVGKRQFARKLLANWWRRTTHAF